MSDADDAGPAEPSVPVPPSSSTPPPPPPPPAAAPAPGRPTERSATNALICAVVSLVLSLLIPILGVILAVVTFILIPKAEQKILESDGALGGESQLRSARIIAIVSIVVAVVNFIIAVTIVLD